MKLELRGITKRFGSLVANDSISLTIQPGEIHCLLGENGAGKSTLMNVLYGLTTPDEGEIVLDDEPVSFAGPADAMAAGIGMVHQHFMLVPVFTVAENVMLGTEQTYGPGLLDTEATRARIREISQRYGFDVDPDAVVEHLPVGVQQRVEIIKALVREAKVLILDEPTAVLTPQETDELMQIMHQLTANGTSIAFITHKLREVKAVADRITVLRLGGVVAETTPEASESDLASLMVGRAVNLVVDKGTSDPGEVALTVADLDVVDEREQLAVDAVSFTVRTGEILVVAGVQGNGQTELTEAILGLPVRAGGSVRLDGTELLGRPVRQVLRAGVGFVPEDRRVDGLVGQFTIAENLVLDRHDDPSFAVGSILRHGRIRRNAEERVDEFDIRAESIDTRTTTLSGGNQQKVVLARELSRPLKLLVATQPTRGLDVGSIEFVHKRLLDERDEGTPVVLVSTELDEAGALADRILVMYRGRVVGIVPGDTDRDVLGLMTAGYSAQEAFAQAAAHPTLAEHPEQSRDAVGPQGADPDEGAE